MIKKKEIVVNSEQPQDNIQRIDVNMKKPDDFDFPKMILNMQYIDRIVSPIPKAYTKAPDPHR